MYKILKLLLFLLCFIYCASCSDILVDDSNKSTDYIEPLSINKAKEWFETNFVSNSTMFKASSLDTSYLSLRPMLNWDIALIDNDSDWSVVELPWDFENGTITMADNNVSSYCRTNGNKPEQILRLVILKNKKTDQMYGFKMAVVPELDYMLSREGEFASSNYYLNRDRNLSGMMLFYSVNDEFINGWKYLNGEIVGKVSLAEKMNSSNSAMKVSNKMELVHMQTCYFYSAEIGGFLTYHMDCYNSSFHVFSSGSGGSGGFSIGQVDFERFSGNGKYGGSGGNATSIDLEPDEEKAPGDRTDCNESITKNTSKINTVLTDISSPFPAQIVNKAVNTLRTYASNKNEYAITIDVVDNQYYARKDQNNGIFSTSNSSSEVNISSGTYTYMVCHTHPDDKLSSPSPSDVAYLGKAFMDGSPNIFANLIFAADGSEYAVYVSDKVAFANFCNNASNASFFDKTADNYFKTGTSWATDYKNVYNNLINQGYTPTDANSYALTSVLDKYNIGVKIAVRNTPQEKFKEQKTEKLKNNYQPQKCP